MTKELLFQKAINWATCLHANTLLGQMTGRRIDQILQDLASDETEYGLEFRALQHAFITAARELGIGERTMNFWIAVEDNYQSDLQSYARTVAQDGPLPYDDVAKSDIKAFKLRGRSGLYFSELPNLLISSGILHHYRL